MNPDSSNLRTTTQLRTDQSALLATQTGVMEFATVEEMIRVDATRVVVPPAVRDRLAKSVQEAGPADMGRPWWKRILG